MPVSSVERPVGALRQRMLEDMAMRAARARGLKLDIERLETTIEELSPDLAIASGRERLAGIEALRIDAEAAIERFASSGTENVGRGHGKLPLVWSWRIGHRPPWRHSITLPLRPEPGQQLIAWPAGHALEQSNSGAAAAYA